MILRIGATGKNVELVQDFLIQQKYSLVKNGVFDEKTADDVADWQKKIGLADDGVVGPLTTVAMGLKFVEPTAPLPGSPWDGSFVLGIDVARYQKNLNTPAEWKALWDMGVRWMYPKAADGVSGPDSQFARLKAEGKAAGMICSAGYCFFRLDQDPIKQAEALVRMTNGVQKGELPHVLDVEWDNASADKGYHDSEHGGTRGTLDVAGEEKAYAALVRIEQLTMMTPWIYTSAGFFVAKNAARFARFPVIIANYSKGTADDKIKIPAPWKRATVRQYTDKIVVGDVDGIDGDRFLGNLSQLKAYTKV